MIEPVGRETARVWLRREEKFGQKMLSLLGSGDFAMLYGGRMSNAILPMRLWLPEASMYKLQTGIVFTDSYIFGPYLSINY